MTSDKKDSLSIDTGEIALQEQHEALLERTNFVEKINNLLPSTVYIFDLKTQSIVYVNDQVKELFGFSPDEFKTMGPAFYANMMHPDDIPKLIKEQSRVHTLKEGEIIEIEYRIRDHSYNYHWISDRITVFSRENGGPRMAIGIATDINDRKLHEETLQMTIEKMNLSLSAARMGTWEWDTATSKLYWDKRMYEIHDVTMNQSLDIVKALNKIVVTEDWEAAQVRAIQALDNQQDFSVTYRIRSRSGQVRHIRIYGKSMLDKSKRRMYGVGWDITEDIEAERQVAEARASMISSTKMAALGEMSGGIAHEINNPLTVIQARSFQLTQMLDTNRLDPFKIRQAAESISRTAEKIARIIKSLRSFARDGAFDPFDIVSAKRIVEETLEFCRTRFYNHGIEVEMEPISEELEIECRIVQIEQVLLNLLNNSFDAIENLPEKWVRVSVIDDDPIVEIRVVDSGSGIPAHIIEKIMHPFFTTKEVGKGTGLGLSISSGIVKSHNGELSVDRNAKNTTFVIRIPKLQE
ncbi:Sensor protein FixL [compost metagenome]